MVLIQHQYACQPSSYYGGSQLPMGNDDKAMPSYDYASVYSGYPSMTQKTFKKSTTSSLPRWILPAAYAVALISWLSAFRVNGHLTQVYNGLEAEIQTLELQREESRQFLDSAKKSRRELMKQQNQLKRTQRMVQHEIRMKEELHELDTSDENKEALRILNGRHGDITATWVQQRQEALYNKIYNLQDFIREQSRKRVVEKYGPGPHRVKFTVKPDSQEKQGVFVVELASLDLVPHSIETFLDMATNGLWDNTVFYHHDTQHHVIAAAPVHYGTFDTKHYHFAALGYTGVSYPEYSPMYPHEEYTIGFSGKGPNFYINTMDNQQHHGPGGQGHHGLPTDADPCFGRIISGKSVVKDMMPGTHTSEDPISWQDFDLNQIVRIELIK